MKSAHTKIPVCSSKLRRAVLAFICVSLVLIIAGCQMTEKPQAENSQVVYPIDLEKATRFSVRQNQMIFEADYKDSDWFIKQQPTRLAALLVEELSSLTGTEIEEPTNAQEYLTLKVENEDYIISKTDKTYYLKKGAQNFQLEGIGPLIKNFDSLLFLGEIIQPDLKEPFQEITLRSGDSSYSLTTQSTLSAVEQAPLISGWFIKDYYNKDMSLSYTEANYLIPLIDELRGRKLVKPLSYENPTLILQFDSQEERYTLFEVDNHYYLENTEQEQWEIPNVTGLFLMRPVIDRIEPFLSLIMVDALTEVSINTPDQEWTINVESNEIEDQTTQIAFNINNHPIEEKNFRKLYQYLAVLSASEEYQNQLFTDAPSLVIHYQFLSGGVTHTRDLKFYPLMEDQKKAAVMIDQNIDFIIDTEQLEQLLQQLEKFS